MATNQPTNTVQPEGSLRPSIETEPARASSSKKSFTVPGGYLKGVYDGVLLSTDLEPDDAVAIKLLAPELRGVPMLVVVGQGPSDKTQLAVQMLAAYDIGSSARVVQGQTSEVPFPTQMIDLYASASSSSAILKPEIVAGGDAAALTADFLARCSAPFALLLKPPHEMANLDTTILSKTTAAVYGSFNLATFRAALPASLSEEEKLLRQEALLHSFKLALWVERSLSVGRDSVLESEKFDGGGKKLWDCLLADKELVGMIGAWNAQTLKTFAPKVSKGMNEIKAICDKSTAGPDATSPLWPELLVLLEGIDKKVQVMKSITKCKGSQVCAALSPPQARAICRPRVTCRPWPRFLAHSLPLSFPRALASDPFASGCVQVCHADTLVAALLLDDKDALGPYTKKCRASHDAQLKPKPVLDGCEDSRLAVLMASEAQRDDLEAASIGVLAACTACQMSPDSPRTPISRVASNKGTSGRDLLRDSLKPSRAASAAVSATSDEEALN
jgi:hypothetical protein